MSQQDSTEELDQESIQDEDCSVVDEGSDQKEDQDEVRYHHFSLNFDPAEVCDKFKQVRVVLVAGSAHRAEDQANFLAETFNGTDLEYYPLEHLTTDRSRFSLFHIGPVLISDHGMGAASMSIALHELFLMCQQADILDKITLIRFGTCGGIGVEPGTICVTNRALDPLFQDFIELKICNNVVRRPCVMDLDTAELIEKLANDFKYSADLVNLGEFEIRSGATIGTNDFYEEQGRTNGAICDHTDEDKMRFLEEASELGVINMEMESNFLAAMCHKLGVKFGVICVALNNRLESDKVDLSHDEISLFEKRLFWLNTLFIENQSSQSNETDE